MKKAGGENEGRGLYHVLMDERKRKEREENSGAAEMQSRINTDVFQNNCSVTGGTKVTEKAKKPSPRKTLFIQKLDSACNFVCAHASCANVDRFDIAACFNDFDFLYIGFPFSVCTSTNLTTVNADSMTFHLAFFTNFTSSHSLHLLNRLYVTQQRYSSRKVLNLQEKILLFSVNIFLCTGREAVFQKKEKS